MKSRRLPVSTGRSKNKGAKNRVKFFQSIWRKKKYVYICIAVFKSTKQYVQTRKYCNFHQIAGHIENGIRCVRDANPEPIIARIAQLVEHNLAKVRVASSSLVSRSFKEARMVESVDTQDLKSCGH